MAKGNDAADAIKRLIKQNEQLKLAAEILDEYGSFDNAIAEAKIKMESVRNELAGEVFKLTETKQSIETLTKEISEQRKNAELDCSLMRDTAEKDAEKILEEARNKAGAMLMDAENQIRRKLNDDNGHIAALSDKRSELEAEIASLELRRDEIKLSADEAADRLAKVKADIARVAGSLG